MKQDKKTIKTYFEKGDVPTEEQFVHLIDSYIDSKQETGKPNRRFVIDENGEVSVTEEQKLPEYSLTEISNTKIGLVKNNNIIQEVDLSNYIDDTNLARLVSGTVDTNGIATFKRDDNSTFTVDFSNLISDKTKKLNDLEDVETPNSSLYIMSSRDADDEKGIDNVAIGYRTLEDGAGDNNVIIGSHAGKGVGADAGHLGNKNVFIGKSSGESMKGAEDNVFIGYQSGLNNQWGDRNILIGSKIQNEGIADNDKLNIGNTIKGDLSTKTIEIEKLKLTKLDEGNSKTDQYITIDSSGVIRKVDQQNTNSSNQLQADWNQTDNSQANFIKNKTQTIERTVVIKDHSYNIVNEDIYSIDLFITSIPLIGFKYNNKDYFFHEGDYAADYTDFKIENMITFSNPITNKSFSDTDIFKKFYYKVYEVINEKLPHWSTWQRDGKDVYIPRSGYGATIDPILITNITFHDHLERRTLNTHYSTKTSFSYTSNKNNIIGSRKVDINDKGDEIKSSETFFIDDFKIPSISSWRYLETTSDLINNGEGKFPFITSNELNNLIPEYTLSEITNNKLAFLKNNTIIKEIDLNTYLDDTNLARLVSGTVDTNGIATFKRDDDSTFTVDLSNLKEESTFNKISNLGNETNETLVINKTGESIDNNLNSDVLLKTNHNQNGIYIPDLKDVKRSNSEENDVFYGGMHRAEYIGTNNTKEVFGKYNIGRTSGEGNINSLGGQINIGSHRGTGNIKNALFGTESRAQVENYGGSPSIEGVWNRFSTKINHPKAIVETAVANSSFLELQKGQIKNAYVHRLDLVNPAIANDPELIVNEFAYLKANDGSLNFSPKKAHFINSSVQLPSVFSGVIETKVTLNEIKSASDKALTTKEFNDTNYKIRTLNTSTPQTSASLNTSFPIEENPVNTQVINLDTTESYMYIRISNTTWRRYAVGENI